MKQNREKAQSYLGDGTKPNSLPVPHVIFLKFKISHEVPPSRRQPGPPGGTLRPTRDAVCLIFARGTLQSGRW